MVLVSFIPVLCNRTKSLQHCLRLPTTVGIQPLISYKKWTLSHYPHQTTVCSDNIRPCRTFSSAHGNKSFISCRNSSLPPKDIKGANVSSQSLRNLFLCTYCTRFISSNSRRNMTVMCTLKMLCFTTLHALMCQSSKG